MAKNFNILLFEGDKLVLNVFATPQNPAETTIPDYVCEDIKEEYNSLGYNVDHYQVVEVFEERNQTQ